MIKITPSIKNGKLTMEIPCGQKLIQTTKSFNREIISIQSILDVK